ncbi:hypothetical protein ACFL1H_05830 [Nanoarchaeota archaeon]
MVYYIEGELEVQEKPAKYLNNYVHSFREEIVTDFSEGIFKQHESSKRRCDMSTPYKPIAEWFNRKGYNFQRCDSMDKALDLCKQSEISVGESKTFAPRNWGEFLTQRFGETDEYQTLSGELIIWPEFRLPTPWVYFFSYSDLDDNVFTFEGDNFIRNHDKSVMGFRTCYGLITPYFHATKTRNKIQTTERIGGSPFRLRENAF